MLTGRHTSVQPVSTGVYRGAQECTQHIKGELNWRLKSQNVENVQLLQPADFIWLFCQYLPKSSTNTHKTYLIFLICILIFYFFSIQTSAPLNADMLGHSLPTKSRKR